MDINDNKYLAKQLKKGSNSAYDRLMTVYYQKLCAYANALIGDASQAEDIVQNVFVKIWIKRKEINPEASFKNFLYKSVYNEFVDQYRKNKPVIYLEKKYFEAIDTTIKNENRNIEELIKLVDEEINKLPKKCRQTFILNKKEGLTHMEISEHLNVSTKTVEGHITKAFKILSKNLASDIKLIFFLSFGYGASHKILNS